MVWMNNLRVKKIMRFTKNYTMTFKLKDASENVGKDELGDTSLHLRVDKLFHHIHLKV
jgi:hypothetical protein